MPIPKKSKRISRSFIRDEVYNTLFKWIMDGVLRPGEKLMDKELSETLGVSRTPVREALKRLEDKALVEASASRWTRVAGITINEAKLIYPIISTLESLAGSMAITHLSAQDYKLMEQANVDLKEAMEARNPIKASGADTQFHDAYIKKSGNHFLIDILQDLKIKHRRLEVIYFGGCACASDSLDEHSQIVDALKSKDVDRAVKLIRSNWLGSLERLQRDSKKKR